MRVAQPGRQLERKRPVLVRVVGSHARRNGSSRSPMPAGLLTGAPARSARSTPGRTTLARAGVDQVLTGRVAERVVREEQHLVRRLEGDARRAHVPVPVLRRGEVARVVVGDQIELGDHEAIAERAQQKQVIDREDLRTAMHEIGRRGSLQRLLIGDESRPPRSPPSARSPRRPAPRGHVSRSARSPRAPG